MIKPLLPGDHFDMGTVLVHFGDVSGAIVETPTATQLCDRNCGPDGNEGKRRSLR
jgi:hypothetical protein